MIVGIRGIKGVGCVLRVVVRKGRVTVAGDLVICVAGDEIIGPMVSLDREGAGHVGSRWNGSWIAVVVVHQATCIGGDGADIRSGSGVGGRGRGSRDGIGREAGLRSG